MDALIKSGWYGDDVLIGVAVVPHSQDYRLVWVRRQKGEVRLLQTAVIGNREELLKQLRAWPAQSIAVFIDSASIVEKVIDRAEQDVIAAVMGVRVENRRELYAQQIPVDIEQQYVSLIRRTEVEAVFADLEEVQERIISLSISPIVQAYLIPALPDYAPLKTYSLQTERGKYGWQENLAAHTSPTAVIVGTDQLASALEIPLSCLPAYAMLYHRYALGSANLAAFPELVQNEKKAKQITTWTRVLGFALMILLSTCILGGIWQISQHLQSQANLSLIEKNSELLRKMRENEIRNRQATEFLDQASSGILSHSRVSFYADRLAQIAPEDLVFSRLILYPTVSQFRKMAGEKPEQLPDILLSGQALSAQAISGFSAQLQELAFVQEARIMETTFDFQEESHRFLIQVFIQGQSPFTTETQ